MWVKAQLRINRGFLNWEGNIYKAIRGVCNSTGLYGGLEMAHSSTDISCILIAHNPGAIRMQTMNHRQAVTKWVVPAKPCLLCVSGRKRKVFLIVFQVRGSGSNITHDQIGVVFGELLAGYLSWPSIPLLGLGLCVGWLGVGGGVRWWADLGADVWRGD